MRKRALQVRMVPVTAPTGDAEATPAVSPEELNRIAKEQVENLAITVGAVLLAKKAADTLSELILIAGRKYI